MSPFGRSSPISFPSYILPSLPFRRKYSSDSATSTSSREGKDTTGSVQDDEPSPPRDSLPGHTSYIRCSRCAADLCMTGQIVSRGFQGRFGRAYLVAPLDPWSTTTTTATTAEPASSLSSQLRKTCPSSAALRATTLPNTHSLQAMRRNLVTGGHTVSDVICAACGVQLGWRYIHADEESQRYKVGKFILEAKRTAIVTRWEDDAGPTAAANMVGGRTLDALMDPAHVGDDEVEFDSQDEDECEDLFMGQWTPERALKRRKAKVLVPK